MGKLGGIFYFTYKVLHVKVSVTMNFVSTVTSKGQILIPVSIRKKLGIKSSDRISFVVSGESFVARKAPDIETMYGFIKTKKKLSDKALEKAIDRATELGMSEDL